MSQDIEVTVVVVNEDGSEAYRALHAIYISPTEYKAFVRFSPQLPPLTNGQTIRIEGRMK